MLIASYQTSAMLSSHVTMTRYPAVEGERHSTHAREGTNMVRINSSNPTTSHFIGHCFFIPHFVVVDIEGLTTGRFSDMMQTMMGDV